MVDYKPGSCVISAYKDGGVGVLFSEEQVRFGIPSVLYLKGSRLEVHQSGKLAFSVDGITDEGARNIRDAVYHQIFNVSNPGTQEEAYEISSEVTFGGDR